MANGDNTVNLQIVSAYDPSGGALAEGGLNRVITLGQAIGPATATGAAQAESALKGEGAAAGQAAKTLDAAGAAGKKAGGDTAKGAKDAAEKLSGLAKEAHGFLETLKEGALGGFSAGLGIGAAETALHAIEAIGEKAREIATEIVVDGVRANAELERQVLGLASTLRSVEPDKYLSFESAKNAAREAVAYIRQQSIELGQDSHTLLETYSANISALAEAGVKDTGRQVELVTALISAASSKGISGARAMTDVIDILNGRVGQIVLAKELGFEGAAFKEAVANGTQYNFIMSKLVGYNEGLREQADSFGGITTSISETVHQLEGIATKNLFEGIEGGLREFRDTLKDPSLRNDAAVVATAVGDLAAKIIRLGAVAVEHRADIANQLRAMFGAVTNPALAAFDIVKDGAAAFTKPQADALRITEERIEINRRLIDQADTEEKKAVLRNSLARQLAGIEAEIAANQGNVGDGPVDTPYTEKLQRQAFLIQDQNNFLDAQAGKHEIVASKVEHVRELSAHQKQELVEINAELDNRAGKDLSITDQLRNQNQALEEEVRKVAERNGLDQGRVAGLRNQADIQREFPNLTAAQNLELSKGVLAIVQQKDARDKLADAAEKAAKKEADAYDKNLGIIADTNAKLSEQKVRLDDLKASDRPNKSQEILTLERQITAELAKQKEAQDALKKIETDRAKAKEQANPVATANRDAAQRALDDDKLDPNRDYSDADLQARADRRAAQRAERDRQQRIIDNKRGPDELDTSGDTGPLSDANFEETARSRVPAADGLAKAADGVASAINEKLAPANEQLTAAADALPGQLAGITGPLGTLLSTQAAHFDALTGLIETQAGVSDVQQGFIDNLAKNYAALDRRLTNYIASQG